MIFLIIKVIEPPDIPDTYALHMLSYSLFAKSGKVGGSPILQISKLRLMGSVSSPRLHNYLVTSEKGFLIRFI